MLRSRSIMVAGILTLFPLTTIFYGAFVRA